MEERGLEGWVGGWEEYVGGMGFKGRIWIGRMVIRPIEGMRNMGHLSFDLDNLRY